MTKLLVPVKLFLGSFFTIAGLLLIYRPDLFAKILRIVKEIFLNESYYMLKSRKLGVLFMLLGFLLLYMGLSRLFS